MSLTALQLVAAVILGGMACLFVGLRNYIGLVPCYVLLGGINLIHFSPAVSLESFRAWEAITPPISLLALLLIALYRGASAARIAVAIVACTSVGLPLLEIVAGSFMGGSLFFDSVVAIPFEQALFKMATLVVLMIFTLAAYEQVRGRIGGIRFWALSTVLFGSVFMDALLTMLVMGGSQWFVQKLVVAAIVLVPAGALLLFAASPRTAELHGLGFWFGGRSALGDKPGRSGTQRHYHSDQQAHGQLDNILETQLVYAYAVDLDLRYTLFNKAHADLVRRVNGTELRLGMELFSGVSHKDWVEEIRIAINQALRGENYRLERQIETRDGEHLVLDTRYGPVLDELGHIAGVGVCAIDVSDVRRTGDALKASEQRWQLALEGSQEGLWDWNIEEETLFLSKRWYEITGYDIDEGIDVSCWKGLLHPDDRLKVGREAVAHLRGSDPYYHSEHRIRVAGGQYRWVSERGIATFDAQGKPLRMIGTMTDIDDAKCADERIRQSEELLSYAFEVADEGIWDAHIPSGRVFYSPRFLAMLGYSLEEFGDNLAFWPRFIHPDDRARVAAMLQLPQSGGGRFEERFRMYRQDGEIIHILSRGRVVSWRDDGQPLRVVGIHKDITQDVERLEQIESLAFYDSLTNLPNRRLLTERAEQSLALARRNKGSLAVLVIDLDKFKDVNDTLGHDVGDLLLVEVSQAIRGCLRDVDTLCRQGGDEFTIILPDCSGISALEVAERIADAVEKPLQLKTHRVQVEASIGVACYPEDGEDLTSLLKHADIAMYQAKQRGIAVSLFHLDQAKVLERRVMIEKELHEGMETEQVYLEYQPKIDLLSGQIEGVEALARWNHPELGMVSPAEFVTIAEQSAQIHRLGRRVLDLACRQLMQWRGEGINLSMAVNLSAQELQNEQLPDYIASLLSRYQIGPRQLEIELTETAIMGNVDRSIALLERIRALGIRVAVDDFGTGYSSFSYLNQLPIASIKIDRTFVSQLGRTTSQRGDAETIIRAIVGLAHNLDLQVVAEGVETPLQQSYLQRLRCDQGQGYLFCRPTSAGEVTRLIREQGSLLAQEAG
ncbi:sensor domain-containing protein [Aestuariirhabdus litorea]|uniref:sensor domain-containing protein n=1 Tax=Aestuariirhabdus litorea TaxID=2528527 RepID=UPI0013E389C2|nr:GGDEF and EAL domain-containing protein [Aestuariirhabdus litorea]